MQVEILDEVELNDKKAFDMLINAICVAAKTETGREDFEVSLTITDDDGIKALNKQYRGVDAATDVLSFPLVEYDGYGGEQQDFDGCERNPESGLIMLGDIVLNFSRAVQQAQDYGHSTEREACYLCVHSVLHLLGYDHMEDDDRIIMRSREEEIMNAIGLAR